MPELVFKDEGAIIARGSERWNTMAEMASVPFLPLYG